MASIEYLKLQEMDIALEKEKLKKRRKERRKRQATGKESPEKSTKASIS